MKKRKLSCLLALIAFASLPLSACDEEEGVSGGSQQYQPAFNEHFYWEDARAAYSEVVRYDGTIKQVVNEHNLAIIYSTANKQDGTVTETYQVVDLLEGKVIYTDEVTNPKNVDASRKRTLNVTIEYPVIAVERNNPSWDYTDERYEDRYSYSYYWAKQYGGGSGLVIASDVHNNEHTKTGPRVEVKQHYSLYEVKIETTEKVYWVNEDLKVLREFNSVQTGGYSIGDEAFDASFGDFLYSWDFSETTRMIQVYNKEGVCSMQYTIPSDVGFVGWNNEPFVLNNGNILIQEHTLADSDATEYTYKRFGVASEEDFETGNLEMKVNLTSKIIDFKTGEVTVVDLDYVVCDLSAAYADAEAFPFDVRESDENQAYITKIENKTANRVDYVTLDNEGNINYTVKNDWLKAQTGMNTMMGSSSWQSMGKITENYYVSPVTVKGQMQYWIFDLDGNKIVALPETWGFEEDDLTDMMDVMDQYIVTESGIYDYNRNCLYDITKSNFFNTNERMPVHMGVMDGKLSILAVNNLTLEMECYQFDGKDFVRTTGDGFRFTANEELPQGNTAMVECPTNKLVGIHAGADSLTWTLYNGETAILKMQVESLESPVLTVCKDVAYATTQIDGKDIVYVVKANVEEGR